MIDYSLLTKQAVSLLENCPYVLSNLANLSALLYEALPDLNWAGFYFRDGENLILGPFQGKTACTVIPLGKGVCGTAAIEDQTQLVRDVHAFPGHIACDSASNSEVVVPIHSSGSVIGVLDLDSPSVGRFTEADQVGLESIVREMEQLLDFGRFSIG